MQISRNVGFTEPDIPQLAVQKLKFLNSLNKQSEIKVRKLVLILLAFIAMVTFIRTMDTTAEESAVTEVQRGAAAVAGQAGDVSQAARGAAEVE